MIQIKINQVVFSIYFLSEEDDECLTRNEGYTSYREHKIVIKESLSQGCMKRILVHELCHAILYSQGRSFQHRFSEEELCEFVAFNYDYIIKLLEEIRL